MIAVESAGDRHVLVTPSFRIRFEWVDDRWTHSIDLSIGGSWRTVAATVETSRDFAESDRVVSPAYQDIRFQGDGAEVQALLLGQAGPHHFSAVFSMRESADSVLIGVDVADRCRGPISALAATYRVDLVAAELASAGPDAVTWRPDGSRGALVFGRSGIGGDQTRIALAESGRRGLIVQASAAVEPSAATHRLYYSWRWSADPPRN